MKDSNIRNKFRYLLTLWIITFIFISNKILASIQNDSIHRLDFTSVDQLAIDPPRDKLTSVQDLVQYFQTNTKNKIELSRAIYKWITENIAYDYSQIHSKTPLQSKSDQVFRKRKAICQGYANLFLTMCNYGNIKCKVIKGFGKGMNYQFGQKIKNVSGHAWNAIQLEGNWYLIDVTWGAGYINGDTFVKQFSNFYFCPLPQYFILDHYPEDTNWQLLENIVSLKEFENSPQPSFTFPFYLKLPEEKILKNKKEYHFQIEVPNAQSVILIKNNHPIEFKNIHDNLFELKSNVEGKNLRIGAKYPNHDNYDILLRYQIK